MRKDNSIDSTLKSEMQQLTALVIEGVVQNRPEKILELSSDTLKGMLQGHTEGMISLYGPKFQRGNYKILNEFHLKNAEVGKKIILATGTSGWNDYFFNITAQNPETFIETGYFDAPDEQNVLTTVWGKYDDVWKLNYIHIGILAFAHKNMVDWYLSMKEDFEKGYLCDAGLKLMLLSKLMSKKALPFVYVKNKEIQQYCERVYASLQQKIRLPLKIEEIAGQPEIVRIYPLIRNDSLYPVVSYVSQSPAIKVDDLKQECDVLHAKLPDLFHGIDRNNTKIIYEIFEKVPGVTPSAPHHTFVKEF